MKNLLADFKDFKKILKIETKRKATKYRVRNRISDVAINLIC